MFKRLEGFITKPTMRMVQEGPGHVVGSRSEAWQKKELEHYVGIITQD
jgi:hypothetical protein